MNEIVDEFGVWMPILDYSVKKNISVSTIRRYIKANKISFKIINGKYWIFADNINIPRVSSPEMIRENQQLKIKLQKLQEEVHELQMLVSIYENENKKIKPNRHASSILPALPFI